MSYAKPAIKCPRMIVRTATLEAARIYTAIAEHPNSRWRRLVGEFYQYEDERFFQRSIRRVKSGKGTVVEKRPVQMRERTQVQEVLSAEEI